MMEVVMAEWGEREEKLRLELGIEEEEEEKMNMLLVVLLCG